MKIIVRRRLVALRLRNMSRNAKVNQGKATSEAIIRHPEYFPPLESNPFTDALSEATANLAKAVSDTATGSHESVARANSAEVKWDAALRNIGYYVQQKADANPALAEQIISSAALQVRKEAEKVSAPLPVKSLRAIVTGLGNAIELKIKSDNRYGVLYEIMMTQTPDVESSWVSVADITARKMLVNNLANGERYYFKTRAINKLGKSVFSNIVSQIAA